MDVAEGAEPAPARQTAEVPMTLTQRLAAVRADCDSIGKQDIQMEKDGKRWTIKGHTVEAILSEVRPLLAKHGVSITPNLAERSYQGNRCDVLVDFEFARLDDPTETKVIRWGGAGTDNGDKAFAKAGTNALKEVLKKLFLITDRDDAKEETESVEHRTEEGVNRADLERATGQRKLAIEQWAKAVKMALEKATTKEDVQRLERENRDQLASEDLPEVTRTFFIDLIEKRKKELA